MCYRAYLVGAKTHVTVSRVSAMEISEYQEGNAKKECPNLATLCTLDRKTAEITKK